MSFTTSMWNSKSFTLIELLIVIVIIGILAVALIPRLTGMQARAKETAIKAKFRDMMTQAAMYYTDNQTYSNFCISASAQASINDLINMWVKAACYTHALNNQHNNNRGAAAFYNNKRFAVNSIWIVTFDQPKITGSNWHAAMTTCSTEGKRLADIEQLRALFTAQWGAPRWEPYRPYWSATDVSTNTFNAYYVHLDQSIYSGNIWSWQPKTYTPIYVVCVE